MNSPITCPKCGKSLDDPPNYCPACGEDLRGLDPFSDTLSGEWNGKVIDGRYRVKEKLGEGGMGTVFKVEHVRMGKLLALKVLRPDLATDRKLRVRFQQEARLVSRLSHPNTIQVFDSGELEDGSLYLAMEYLSGRDLAWTLRNRGVFAEEKAIAIGAQVLSSLSEAHDQDIVHRDIKPANVMLVKRKDRDDLVKVLDFGIAKLNEGEGRQHITGVTDFVGTPAYMSPEQARGEELDDRSDLYSVGAMLFELVTGRGPFIGTTAMAVVTQHLTAVPPRLAEVAPGRNFNPRLEQVIRRALSKARQDRFASAEEMREELEQVRGELGLTFSEFTPLPEEPQLVARREDFDRYERSLRIRRVAAPVLALGLLAAAGAGGWQYLKRAAAAAPLLTAEREPNDEPGQANPLGLGMPLTGRIGTPLSASHSDRDVYVLNLSAPTALTVELAGVADMNLVLEVAQLSADGPPWRVFLDDARTGEGERVDALLLQPGPVYVRVEERAYFTEPPRPPRESSRATYTLTVSATPGDGTREVEPNDTVDTATIAPANAPLTAFTGAAVPYDATFADQRLSTLDFLAAPAGWEGPTWVLVIPPAQGTLGAVDSAELEGWRQKSARGEVANLPRMVRLSGAPEVLSLGDRVGAGSRARGVRIQPIDPAPAPGSAYTVVFFNDQPGGLEAVAAAARRLEAAGEGKQAEAVIRRVERSCPKAPGLPELRAASGVKGLAEPGGP